MEIVLLWLDDLDDLVFLGAHVWERLQLSRPEIGLAAVLLLVVA